jgi:ADP-ribose pyrophosphatase YjhB (NUDIX family)
MKKLNVTFFYKIIDGEIFILLGRNFKLNKLNGFGGKVKDGESLTESAQREIQEELNFDIDKNNLEEVGVINFLDRQVFFYIYEFEHNINDFNFDYNKGEVYDLRWVNIKDKDVFLSEMLEGDNVLIEDVENILLKVKENKPFEKFEINKNSNENPNLMEQTRKIYK